MTHRQVIEARRRGPRTALTQAVFERLQELRDGRRAAFIPVAPAANTAHRLRSAGLPEIRILVCRPEQQIVVVAVVFEPNLAVLRSVARRLGLDHVILAKTDKAVSLDVTTGRQTPMGPFTAEVILEDVSAGDGWLDWPVQRWTDALAEQAVARSDRVAEARP